MASGKQKFTLSADRFISNPKFIPQKVLFMETFNNIVSTTPLVLVDFFATWCGPCKMMHPVLEDLKKKMGDNLRIVKIDIDNNASVFEHYQIRSVPTFMLFHNGENVWKRTGLMSLTELTNVVNQYKN